MRQLTSYGFPFARAMEPAHGNRVDLTGILTDDWMI